MQNTDKTSSAENIQPSSSLPTHRTHVGHLLVAALAALAAGLAASLMAVVLMGVLRLEAGVPTPVELFGDHVLKLLSVGQFIQLLIKFGPNAKTEPQSIGITEGCVRLSVGIEDIGDIINDLEKALSGIFCHSKW